MPLGELFRDNREAGNFVQTFVSRLKDEKDSGQLLLNGRKLLNEHLLVKQERSEQLTYFIDLGVYTRNRIFRILGSTKYGKKMDAALRIAEVNKFLFPNGFSNRNFYLPCMGSNTSVADDDNDNAASLVSLVSLMHHSTTKKP